MNKTTMQVFNLLKGKVLFNEPLSKYTWLGVGGPAEVVFIPEDLEDLQMFLTHRDKNIPFYVIGGGSNILVRDGGVKGVVIKLNSPYFRQIKVFENKLVCSAGVKNVSLKEVLLENETGGLEFLCSIPGTVGGAIKTNAGCFGACIGDVLESAVVIDSNGKIRDVLREDFHFSYRFSDFPSDWIVIELSLKTHFEDRARIKQQLDEQADYRREHQPYGVKTAGSTFKNPKGKKAWQLIKDAQCDTLSVGGAKLSEKHCNFMINTGLATAADLENLGNFVIQSVKEKTGVELEWEIQRFGEW